MHKMTLVILAGLALAATSCSREKLPETGNAPKLKIAASVFPIADMARQIGGEDAEVTQLPPPADDAKAAAAPDASLAEMKIVVVVGSGVDDWAIAAAKAAGKKTLNLSQDEDFVSHFDSWRRLARTQADPNAPALAPAAAAFPDPQVWLSVAFAQDFALALVEAMANADPERSERFRARGRAYLKKLVDLDGEYRDALDKCRGKYFVTDRPMFCYLVQAYGLTNKSLADIARQGPDAASEFVKEMQIRTVFVEGRSGVVRASPAASSCGATLVPLETTGNLDMPGIDSYLGTMQSNLRAIKSGFKEGK